jgi:KipI family sensor histidine kinase inhibitor
VSAGVASRDGATGTAGVAGLAGTAVRPFGDAAVLVDVPDAAAAAALAAAVRTALPAAVDVVPGMNSVLVTVPTGTDLDAVADRLRGVIDHLPPPAGASADPRTVTIPVRYQGPDLAAVAELTGLDPAEVVARHTAATYTVAILGFAPGFPYLTGLDPGLTVPRLDTPRPRIPAGSVGLAGGQTCVYPGASPGGWRLIGSTDLPLFDPLREPPALLAPGDRVRFVAVG